MPLVVYERTLRNMESCSCRKVLSLKPNELSLKTDNCDLKGNTFVFKVISIVFKECICLKTPCVCLYIMHLSLKTTNSFVFKVNCKDK